MGKVLTIEYCTSWGGYLKRAVALTQKVLSEHKKKISFANLKPSGSKSFEVKLDDELLFSKKNTGRYPNENEVEDMVKEILEK